MIFRARLLASCTLVLGIAATACSPDMFSRRAEGTPKPGRESYRRIRPECSGLRVAQSQLDVPTFRKLIACFNSNGSMPDVARLVDEASDRTLTDSMRIVNATFLADPQVLAESREVTRGLKRARKWDDLVADFAPLLRDPAQLRALIRLFSFGDSRPLLRETLGNFDARETAAGFELLGRIASSRAFGELRRKIGESPLPVAERERLVDLAHRFVRRRTAHASAGGLIEAMAAGKSAPLWDYAFGADGDAESVRAQADRTSVFLREISRDDGRLLRSMSRFHAGFHRPVECWGGAKTFADPWRNLSAELAAHSGAVGDNGAVSGNGGAGVPGRSDRFLPFITRFATLTAMGIGDLCRVPDEMREEYPALLALTAGRAGGPYVDILERVSAGGLGFSAGYFVGEWGAEAAEALALLQGRPWFGDLLLVLAEFDRGDRARIAAWTSALLARRAEWTATVEAWSRADVDGFFADVGALFAADPAALAKMADGVLELFETGGAHPWFDGWKKVAVDSGSAGLERLAVLGSFPEATRALSEMAEDGRLAAVLADILEILGGGERAKSTASAATVRTEIRKTARHAWVGADLPGRDYPAALDESLRACTRLDPRASADGQRETIELCLRGGGVPVDAFAGLRLAQAPGFAAAPGVAGADAEGRVSFLRLLLDGLVRLPLPLAERKALVEILGARLRAAPALARETVREFAETARARLDAAFFAALHRFQAGAGVALGHWEAFFRRLRLALEDARAESAWLGWKALRAAEPSGAVVGPAPRPPAGELREWIRALECVKDARAVERRAEAIATEFDRAVLGWERPAGDLPQRWEARELERRLGAFLDTLRSAEHSEAARAGLYSWLGGLDPRAAARWFQARGSDPKLVAVMDPGTRELRVRWMTSLDRLESILVNSDFSYLFPANYGLKFIQKFAEAWGDEPRERWPAEIRERYSGRRTPPKLRDVYEDVQGTLRWFERVGGIPTSPDCVDAESGVASRAIADPWATAPDGLISFDVKAKAFNLRQTIDVIAENLPGSGAPAEGGMRFLRDLFWAVNSAIDPDDRDPADPESNPLVFFQRLGDLGGLRAISRGVQGFARASEVAALEDAFAGLAAAVREPAFDRLLAGALADPRGLARWIGEAYRPARAGEAEFRWGALATGALEALARGRRAAILPGLIRFADSALPPQGFPHALAAELIGSSGRTPEAPRGLRGFAPVDRATEARLAELAAWLDQRIYPALQAFPLREAVAALDRDPVLRKALRETVAGWTETRQTPGASASVSGRDSGAPGDGLFARENSAFRRALGLWCATAAPRLAFELASRPDESRLIVDGLIRSAESEAAFDFLEALLRQLPD